MSFSLSCKNPIYIKKTNLLVPCGKCLICRRKYQLSWVVRLQHEYLSQDRKALFLTLSYNNDNLPLNNSLVKKDVQDFLKRLRKFYSDTKIKYFAVGEYGSKTFRPHYHIIIFGLKSYNNQKENMGLAHLISEKIWKKGFCHIGDVNVKTIRYCSKYILKEFVKGYDKEQFEKAGMLFPFSLKSTGLGLKYFMDNIDYIKDSIINNKPISLFKAKIGYPRYYRKKLVDMGIIEEDFYMNNYNRYMDTLQTSMINELKECGYSLDNCYLHISLYQYFNIEKEYKKEYHDLSINIPRRYKSNFKFKTIKFIPYSFEEIEDIQKNHWFNIYKQHYYTSVYRRKLQNTINNWQDSEYE